MEEGGREGQRGERWWVGGGEIEGREFCVRVTMRHVWRGCIVQGERIMFVQR